MKQILFYTLLGTFILGSCTSNKPQEEIASHLGNLQYQIPISEQAKANFDKGLLLLHSFEYDDAREAFEAAIADDSTEVMGYWGVAMSHYKALWGLQNIPAGQETMQRLASTKEERLNKAEEGLERDLWKGIELLYGEGELKERNKKYTDHMAELHSKYESSQEVAAFYALALMWSASYDDGNDVYKLSANVAQGILDENPDHPGAVHYMIHAYDSPEMAHLAIEAADKYATIAPDAAHALHMPSHIYLSRGMWNEVVSSNEDSYQASVNRMERKGLDDNARGYHSYQWLHYGYLQQGRYEKAKELLKDMLRFTERTKSKGARAYLLKMQSMQVLESGSWPLEESPMTIKTSDIGIEKQAQQHFFLALMSSKADNGTGIQKEIDSLDSKISKAELLVTSAGIAMCSAGPTRYAPNKMSIINAKTMLHQMKAMKAIVEYDDNLAEENFKKATALESEARYAYGPPDVVQPSFEQYGYWLLAQNRPEDALAQFETSLKRAPGRAMALKGKMEALESLGRSDEIKAIEEQLAKFWQPDSQQI